MREAHAFRDAETWSKEEHLPLCNLEQAQIPRPESKRILLTLTTLKDAPLGKSMNKWMFCPSQVASFVSRRDRVCGAE